jgi:ATP/ADP translocase
MMERFLRLLNLRPGELRLAFSLWLLLAINTLVLELSDVVATAGFISNVGVNNVPWLWIVTTVITIFAAGGYVVLIDRFSRLNLVTWLLLGLAMFYLLLEMMFALHAPSWLTFPTLYLLADQQFMIMPLAFWALATDVYAVSESKRIFPIVASGAVIGGLLGNGAAAWVTYFAEKYNFDISQIFIGIAFVLIFATILLRIAFINTQIKTRQSRESDSNLRETFKIGADYFLNVPALKAVGLLMLFTGIVLTLVEFNFLSIIENSVGSDLEFQRFLGYYKAVQTIGLLVFQWLITSRLLTKIQLKNAFSFLPYAMTLAVGLALGIPTLLGAASARFVARTVYTAWDDPARKALQGLIPDEKRGRISAFMDSYFITTSTVVGCLILIILLALTSFGVITAQVTTWIYLGITLVAAIAAIFTSVYLRRVYETSMLNYRLARSKRKSVLDGIEF